jgi:hypothetical protein
MPHGTVKTNEKHPSPLRPREVVITGDSVEGTMGISRPRPNTLSLGESVISVKSVVKNAAFAVVQGLSLLQLDGGIDPDLKPRARVCETEQPRISRRTQISPAAPGDRCESVIAGDSVEGTMGISRPRPNTLSLGESVISVKSVVKNAAFAVVQGLSLFPRKESRNHRNFLRSGRMTPFHRGVSQPQRRPFDLRTWLKGYNYCAPQMSCKDASGHVPRHLIKTAHATESLFSRRSGFTPRFPVRSRHKAAPTTIPAGATSGVSDPQRMNLNLYFAGLRLARTPAAASDNPQI